VTSDDFREKIPPLLPGEPGDRRATGRDNQLFMDAFPWRVCKGVPWRDLPQEFGKWHTLFRRMLNFRIQVDIALFREGGAHHHADCASSSNWMSLHSARKLHHATCKN